MTARIPAGEVVGVRVRAPYTLPLSKCSSPVWRGFRLDDREIGGNSLMIYTLKDDVQGAPLPRQDQSGSLFLSPFFLPQLPRDQDPKFTRARPVFLSSFGSRRS